MNAQNINIKCLAFAATALTLTGCGNGPMDKFTEAAVSVTDEDYKAANYVAADELTLEAFSQNGQVGTAGEVVIPKGTPVSILETRVDPDVGVIVRLGIDADEESGLPSDIWVRMDEALMRGLVKEGSAEDRESEGEEEETEVTEEGDVIHAAARKMTYCYRYVKRYLLSTGQVKVYLPGNSAYQAATILPKHGFKKTGNTPKTAKNGEVCVYSGGPKGHGHIEVKRDGKWWYGYGFKTEPMKNRKFIACFKK